MANFVIYNGRKTEVREVRMKHGLAWKNGIIAVLLAGAPGLNLVFTYKTPGGEFVFDTQEIRAVLGADTDFAHPEVYQWTEDYLRQQLKALRAGQEE